MRVTDGWTASYADALSVAAGEAVTLTGREELWDGHRWLWARAADGREGWVPDTLIDRATAGAFAREAYSARELTCRAGDRVEVLKHTHGWVLCRAADGQVGWVPGRCLTAGA